jgi:hypothetical protein
MGMDLDKCTNDNKNMKEIISQMNIRYAKQVDNNSILIVEREADKKLIKELREYNKKIVEEYQKSLFWTKVIAGAVIVGAVAFSVIIATH